MVGDSESGYEQVSNTAVKGHRGMSDRNKPVTPRKLWLRNMVYTSCLHGFCYVVLFCVPVSFFSLALALSVSSLSLSLSPSSLSLFLSCAPPYFVSLLYTLLLNRATDIRNTGRSSRYQRAFGYGEID